MISIPTERVRHQPTVHSCSVQVLHCQHHQQLEAACTRLLHVDADPDVPVMFIQFHCCIPNSKKNRELLDKGLRLKKN